MKVLERCGLNTRLLTLRVVSFVFDTFGE
jgi:hypothetical protein